MWRLGEEEIWKKSHSEILGSQDGVQRVGSLSCDDFSWGPWISVVGSLWDMHHRESVVLNGLMERLASALRLTFKMSRLIIASWGFLSWGHFVRGHVNFLMFGLLGALHDSLLSCFLSFVYVLNLAHFFPEGCSWHPAKDVRTTQISSCVFFG